MDNRITTNNILLIPDSKNILLLWRLPTEIAHNSYDYWNKQEVLKYFVSHVLFAYHAGIFMSISQAEQCGGNMVHNKKNSP